VKISKEISFEDYPVYFIEGPRPWIKSPYYFSLYVLLFRLGGLKNFSQIKKITGTDKILEAMKKISYTHAREDAYDDVERVRDYFDSWFVALEAYDKLFEKKRFKSAYMIDKDVSCEDIGIDSMMECETPDANVNKFMSKALKE
jgi:hypothetical protein